MHERRRRHRGQRASEPLELSSIAALARPRKSINMRMVRKKKKKTTTVMMMSARSAVNQSALTQFHGTKESEMTHHVFVGVLYIERVESRAEKNCHVRL